MDRKSKKKIDNREGVLWMLNLSLKGCSTHRKIHTTTTTLFCLHRWLDMNSRLTHRPHSKLTGLNGADWFNGEEKTLLLNAKR